MDSLNFSRGADRTFGKTAIPSFSHKLATLLKNAGVKDELLFISEELNVIFNEETGFTKWIQMTPLDVVSPTELEAYEMLKDKVSEEEVNKCLFETLGDQENKICITQEIDDKALDEQEKVRIKLESIGHSINYITCETEKSNKLVLLLEQANEELDQEKTQTWSSINSDWGKLPDKWDELLQLTYQYLKIETEMFDDSVNLKGDSLLFKTLSEMEHKLAAVLDKIYQQLKEHLKVGVEVAVIFPRLEEAKIEESQDLVESLAKCQELLETLCQLQKNIKDEILMMNLCVEMVLILFNQISSSVALIANQIKIINKWSKEVEDAEGMDITAEQLADINQALTQKTTLVTAESFIQSLETFASRLNEAEKKCSEDVLLLAEKHISVGSVKKLIDAINQTSKTTEEYTSEVIKYKENLIKFGEYIHNLKFVKEKKKDTKKKSLQDMIFLSFNDYELFVKTLLQMKRDFELLSKASG